MPPTGTPAPPVTSVQPTHADASLSLRMLDAATSAGTLELAIVVPTYNEKANIPVLVDRLSRVLAGIHYEIIVVDDDSPDGTSAAVHDIALQRRDVRILRRVGRRGLASACLEGMMATAAPLVAVMDGDLQHDESALPRMFAQAASGRFDIVVATRNSGEGSMGEFSGARVRLSNLGLRLSRLILHASVSDPMSGFFMVRRAYVEETIYRTSGVGFKILLDLLASSERAVRVAEVPYTFRVREAGESKLDFAVGLEYLYLLLDKLVGRFIPLRFVLYALVGSLGVALHLGILQALHAASHASFSQAQIIATAVSMTFNFLLNNAVTHRDVKLSGGSFVVGLLSFYAACSVGAAINLSVSEQLLHQGASWLMAGFAGLVVSSVWNYGVTSLTTWRRMLRRQRR